MRRPSQSVGREELQGVLDQRQNVLRGACDPVGVIIQADTKGNDREKRLVTGRRSIVITRFGRFIVAVQVHLVQFASESRSTSCSSLVAAVCKQMRQLYRSRHVRSTIRRHFGRGSGRRVQVDEWRSDGLLFVDVRIRVRRYLQEVSRGNENRR